MVQKSSDAEYVADLNAGGAGVVAVAAEVDVPDEVVAVVAVDESSVRKRLERG